MPTDTNITIRGLLGYASNGEEDQLVGVMSVPEGLFTGDTVDVGTLLNWFKNGALTDTKPFAEIAFNAGWWQKYASVRYFISDRPATPEQLESDLVVVAMGVRESKYGAHYSDLTGYLWTDEQFNVGGHDPHGCHVLQQAHNQLRRGR
jgi:hypothetical protein